MSFYHLTLRSSNRKTGPIPVSTSSADTCPPSCPFCAERCCYGNGGPLLMHWREVTAGRRGGSLDELCDLVAALPRGQLWRHDQAGDLPGRGNRINRRQLRQLAHANIAADARGFTYSHKPPTGANIAAIREANCLGFVINWSANDLGHADQLADLRAGPVVVVLGSKVRRAVRTPAGRRVAVCPASIGARSSLGVAVTCSTCGLCARNDSRRPIVGFPAHGASVKRADRIAGGAS